MQFPRILSFGRTGEELLQVFAPQGPALLQRHEPGESR